MQQQVEQGAGAGKASKPLSADAVTWAFRLLIGRDPTTEEVETYRQQPDLAALRGTLFHTWEFHHIFDSLLHGEPIYGMPLFLMRPPTDTAVPWRFEPPSLEEPVSQLCTAAQFDDAAFTEISEAMRMSPGRTRRNWEQTWVVSTLASAGVIAPGKRGIGFGVGGERIPSLLASRGVKVVATDKPAAPAKSKVGADMNRIAIFHPDILLLEDFEQLVEYRSVNMLHLPQDLNEQFDFCWSAAAADRLGSPEAATTFIEESLACLRPGGIAAHTFSFNMLSDRITANHPTICLLRRSDVEQLAQRLIVQGHSVMPINLYPGRDTADEKIELAPDAPFRLKKQYGALIGTSFGLAIRKAA
ncbi:class I SAM-dependent methyltransferase [Roseomonas sp. F4]